MNCNPDITEDLAIQSAHIQYCELEGQITALVPCSIRRSPAPLVKQTPTYTHTCQGDAIEYDYSPIHGFIALSPNNL